MSDDALDASRYLIPDDQLTPAELEMRRRLVNAVGHVPLDDHRARMDEYLRRRSICDGLVHRPPVLTAPSIEFSPAHRVITADELDAMSKVADSVDLRGRVRFGEDRNRPRVTGTPSGPNDMCERYMSQAMGRVASKYDEEIMSAFGVPDSMPLDEFFSADMAGTGDILLLNMEAFRATRYVQTLGKDEFCRLGFTIVQAVVCDPDTGRVVGVAYVPATKVIHRPEVVPSWSSRPRPPRDDKVASYDEETFFKCSRLLLANRRIEVQATVRTVDQDLWPVGVAYAPPLRGPVFASDHDFRDVPPEVMASVDKFFELSSRPNSQMVDLRECLVTPCTAQDMNIHVDAGEVVFKPNTNPYPDFPAQVN